MFARESLCFGSTHGPADAGLYTYLVFPGGLVQWLASHGGLGTDSLFRLQMEQVPSESGRRKKHKGSQFFFHQGVKKEPFNCGRML